MGGDRIAALVVRGKGTGHTECVAHAYRGLIRDRELLRSTGRVDEIPGAKVDDRGRQLRPYCPCPLRDIANGFIDVPRLIVMESLRAPSACGLNVTCTVQDAPAVSGAPLQLSLSV